MQIFGAIRNTLPGYFRKQFITLNSVEREAETFIFFPPVAN